MKNLNKKMIMSVLTLVLTIIALGTTTFAWFSLSTVSKINNIEGTVTAGDGLEVRLTHSDGGVTPWKANLSEDDVNTFIQTIFANKKFNAVTTVDMSSFNQMEQVSGGAFNFNKPAVANEDYLEFTVEFRSQKEGTVELAGLEFGGAPVEGFLSDGSAYLQYDQEEPEEGELPRTNAPVNTKAAYAARVGFEESTAGVVEAKKEVFQFGHADGKAGNTGGTITGNHIMEDKPILAGQWSYLIESKEMYIDESLFNEAEIYEALVFVAETDQFSVDLKEDNGVYSASVIVRIWIEGWDADAYDSVYDSNLIVSLTFAKQEVVDPDPEP